MQNQLGGLIWAIQIAMYWHPRSRSGVQAAEREGARVAGRPQAAVEQAAKRADVQSQWCGAQAAARLRQARCGRGDEEEGVDPAEEPATHAASQSSGVCLFFESKKV